MAADALAEYAGTYAAALGTITLTQDGDHLVLAVPAARRFPARGYSARPAPPPTRVEFIGADWVRALTRPSLATGASSCAIRTALLAGCAGAGGRATAAIDAVTQVRGQAGV